MPVSTQSLFNVAVISVGFLSITNFVSPANALTLINDLDNGNFSNGLNSWDVSGDVSILEDGALLTTASSVNEDDDFPLEEEQLITSQPDNLSPATTKFNFSGNDVTGIEDLEAFLGVAPFDLDPTGTNFGAFEGSAIKQTFMANSGESLKFDWNFLTNEDSNSNLFANDTAFVTLVNTTNSTVQVINLADINSTFNGFSASTGFSSETGVNSFSQGLNAGEYLLGFAVVDDTDSLISSALLLDNVEVISNANQTPEPGTILAFLITLATSTKIKIKKIKS